MDSASQEIRQQRKIIRYIWITAGCLSFCAGVIGAVAPLLPATPFFLLTVYSFSKGSEKFSKWFEKTWFYDTYIKSYRMGGKVTTKKKWEIILSVTVVLSISFYLVDNFFVRLLLFGVFVGHIIYFSFIIDTKKEKNISSTKD